MTLKHNMANYIKIIIQKELQLKLIGFNIIVRNELITIVFYTINCTTYHYDHRPLW